MTYRLLIPSDSDPVPIANKDDVIETLGGGPVVAGDVYSSVDPASVGFEPVAKFALVLETAELSLYFGVCRDGESTAPPSD